MAGAPAEAHEIGVHGFGQIAHVAPFVDGLCAVPLGEFLAVFAVNERDVRELRRRPIERPIDHDLAGSIGQMVIAADNMRHAHVVIVDHDG